MQLRNCEGGGLDMRRAGTVCWCSSRTTFGRYGRFLLTALLEMIGTLVRTDHVATHHRPKRALASTPTLPLPRKVCPPSNIHQSQNGCASARVSTPEPPRDSRGEARSSARCSCAWHGSQRPWSKRPWPWPLKRPRGVQRVQTAERRCYTITTA